MHTALSCPSLPELTNAQHRLEDPKQIFVPGDIVPFYCKRGFHIRPEINRMDATCTLLSEEAYWAFKEGDNCTGRRISFFVMDNHKFIKKKNSY